MNCYAGEGHFPLQGKNKRSVMLAGEGNRRPFTSNPDCEGLENPDAAQSWEAGR
jgi:hypothetical protein